ncbi:MAG: hypothetical protein CVU63_12670, partial [Deltaproteobacteria bacterium HGW-Deltaproteobacteria-20]
MLDRQAVKEHVMELVAARPLVEEAFEDRSRLNDPIVRMAIERVVEALDRGELRVAEKGESGQWVTHVWVKEAVLL